tara:strand:- start:350 stop:622 length:273 start_codon:yes stop_codon:yes gene_type:complete
MKIPGTVTIDLKDYLDLIEYNQNVSTLKDNTSRAAKEMSVFLSFLCTRSDITQYVEEFNRQSTKCKIIIDNGRATIEFKDDTNKVSDGKL